MNSRSQNIYLDSYLSPLAPFLTRADVTDIYVNRPGEVWFEAYGEEAQRCLVPDLTRETLQRLVRQIAALSAQGVSREHPILAAGLPTGERIQVVIPPATRGEIAIAIRKHIVSDLKLEDFAPAAKLVPDDQRKADTSGVGGRERKLEVDAPSLLRQAVRDRKTILISGGTSSGKTTLLNSLLREIPSRERLILIEDTPELQVRHENAVGLVAARSALREAEVGTDDLLMASLRMRPDRIILGELRGKEAVTFLRAINTGHPGSMTTIHADSCEGAIEQLAFLALQAGLNLSWRDLLSYIRSSVDISVNVARRNGASFLSSVKIVEDKL
jgi:type IV secretion system protein VirB11